MQHVPDIADDAAAGSAPESGQMNYDQKEIASLFQHPRNGRPDKPARIAYSDRMVHAKRCPPWVLWKPR